MRGLQRVCSTYVAVHNLLAGLKISVRSIAKTDGLTFKVREIVDGIKRLQTATGSNGKSHA